MSRTLLALWLIIVQFHAFSQTVKGVVIDESDRVLENTTIVNQNRKTGTSTNVRGEFTIVANVGDNISVSYVGKKSEFYTIKPSDTNFILIILKEDISKLKEFSVSSSRIEKVSVEKQDNILDYLSLGKNTLLVLKRKQNQYQLTIEGLDTIYKVYPINDFKPKKLYLDFLQNIHIVCKDSIRQIHFDSVLKVVSTISEIELQYFLKPTIHKYDSTLLVFVYSYHNQRYTLFQESPSNKKIIYQSLDSVRSQFIDHWLWIRSGRPNIVKVGELNSASLQMARDKFVDDAFYGKILCRKLFVNSYVVNNTTLVFDLFADSLFGYNQEGNLLKSISLKEIKDLNPREILQNQDNPSLFYALTEKAGIFSLHTIDLLSGKISNTFTLSEFNFPKNMKVINESVYFILPRQNGLNKLYRINMIKK